MYQRASQPWLKSKQAKKVFSLFRLIHIYSSMVLLALLLFFSLTGLTLNHPEWTGAPSTSERVEPLSSASSWAWQQDISANLLPIQNYIADHFGLTQPRSIDIDQEALEVSFDFPVPAGYAFVMVELTNNQIVFEQSAGSLVGVINDLHKGRHTGGVWKWVIDVVAVASLLFALSGLFILLQNAKYRRSGLVWGVLGLALPLVLYFAFVPSL